MSTSRQDKCEARMIIIASCPTFQQKAVSQSANDIDDSRKRRKVIDTESETDEPAARPACTDSSASTEPELAIRPRAIRVTSRAVSLRFYFLRVICFSIKFAAFFRPICIFLTLQEIQNFHH